LVKDCFFEFDSGGRRGHSVQISCLRNVADLTLGNVLSVIELAINAILYLKIVLIVLR